MKTLLETTVFTMIASMVIVLSLSLGNSVASTAVNSAADMTLDRASRVATEEVQFLLRDASAIVGQATINGTSYNTDSDTLIVAAPSYNDNTTGYFLDGKTDLVAFHYDADHKRLLESIVPAAGSARVARTWMTIARNVESLTFSYICRERFAAPASGNTNAFPLKVTPAAGTVTAYVNGVVQTISVSGATVTVTSNLSAGDSVQIFYSPNTFSAAAPINRIAFSISEKTASSQNGFRTSTASGVAQLRNYRN